MAVKSNKKEFSTRKSILVLFAFLILWWIGLNLFCYSVNLDDSSLLFYVIKFLRIAVPSSALFLGGPIIFIVGYDKKRKVNKKVLMNR